MQKLIEIWIALIITIAVLLLFDAVFKLAGFEEQRAKDTAFIVFIIWIADSLVILAESL